LIPISLNALRRESHPQLALGVELFAANQPIGIVGQLTPVLAREFNANKPVIVAEVSLEALRTIPRVEAFRDIPKFPAIVRDIAVVCPVRLSYGDLESELRKAKEELLVQIEPFNIFQDPSGEKLPPDRKSIAISLTFRAHERTLGNEEVNAACKRLKEHLKATLAVDFRE
jgi:phenylalanyl-tRNA synthetase beta chain